ncbi:MAG: LacI family transcriptional regulator [Lachnospiraceae bacterium]|nr:LacI family transcriptional regulator [Lachnospiraceae bacterium]
MASIKDIAKICGVSVATVSKALNDKDDISDKTKERIKEVAKQMSYFPQYYARAIRMNKSFNIGVLFVDEAMSGLTHDYFSNILNSFKVTAESKGYDITFINSNKHLQKTKTFLEHCRYRGLDGVVIACIDFGNPEVIDLVKSDIPTVTIDKVFKNETSVVSDNDFGMRRLVEYVISKGHRKISYIHGDLSDVTLHRIEIFKEVCKENNIKLKKSSIIASEYRNPIKAAQITKKLMTMQDSPTCILYSDDYSAIGGMGQLKDMHLEIPQDVSVAGFDDIFLASQMVPRLTTVRQDTDSIGRVAAEKLITLIESSSPSNFDSTLIPTQLIEGESVGEIKH